MTSLTEAARAVLETADCVAKAALTHRMAEAWRAGELSQGKPGLAPERPARPERPELKFPRDMPRRRSAGGRQGRIALLHALAHIEVNALDLVCDLIARFSPPDKAGLWYAEWLRVAEEEAAHFLMLVDRLAELGAVYGDLPAHDGLWQIAQITAHDLEARLALVPLVMEARGLDVTPQMIERLERAEDADSAAALRVIYRDEIGHVATGRRWFETLCAASGREPGARWKELVATYFKGRLKPPFNHSAREAAGLQRSWYEAAA